MRSQDLVEDQHTPSKSDAHHIGQHGLHEHGRGRRRRREERPQPVPSTASFELPTTGHHDAAILLTAWPMHGRLFCRGSTRYVLTQRRGRRNTTYDRLARRGTRTKQRNTIWSPAGNCDHVPQLMRPKREILLAWETVHRIATNVPFALVHD